MTIAIFVWDKKGKSAREIGPTQSGASTSLTNKSIENNTTTSSRGRLMISKLDAHNFQDATNPYLNDSKGT
jgi:hypothetical protein